MPPVRMRGDGRKAKNPRKTLLRLLGYMKPYLPTLGVVLLCIIANAVAQTTGSRSLGTLVDSYILPMVRDGSTDFSSLWGYLSKLACIFAVGMISSFLFMFLMVKVSQGTQKHIRDEMFAHMQTLPLRYFDTNTAGNIMSRYTNDIDTLRQMISQSIPQCASSLVTIVVVFVGMLQTSWLLTVVMLFTVTGIVFVTMKVAGKSAKYFVGQQQSLGALNGYVEEMVNGQKVVKVFTHEEACKEQFDKLNEELCRNARIAGTLSNMMGPINNNLGNVQYAILAIVGAGINDVMYALCGVGLATFTMAWFGKKDYERIFSTVMMFGYLVASLGVPIMMKIYEVTGAFENVFVFGFIVCAIIIVCLLVGEKQSAKLPQETVEVAAEAAPQE